MKPSSTLRVMLVAGLVSAGPLHGGAREFKHLVTELRTHCHKAPMGTGFLGFIVRCFSPEGISGLRLAIFDGLEVGDRIPSADFEGLVRQSMGPEVTPLVLVRSPRTGERTLIYAKPHGKRAELLVAMAGQQEVVVVSLEVDPELFQAWLDDPGRMGKRARGDKESAPASGSEAKGRNPRPSGNAPGGGSAPGVEMVR